MLQGVFCVAAVLGITVPALAKTIVVDSGGSGDYTEIQPATDVAGDGDTVLVKPGEYRITQPINFNRLHDPEDPESPAVKKIVLRGEQGPEKTVIACALDEPEFPDPPPSDRASIVLFERGESRESVLVGLALVGGKGMRRTDPDGVPFYAGGGIYCHASSPTVKNCRISENRVYTLYIEEDGWSVIEGGRGGGVYLSDDSHPLLVDCVIRRNGAEDGDLSFLAGAVDVPGCVKER